MDTPKNPLKAALEALRSKNVKNPIAALFNATDRQLVPSQIHGLMVEIGSGKKVTIPKETTVLLIHQGLQRMGLRRGLPPEVWKPFAKAVRAERAATDKRRKDVRAREGLDPIEVVRARSTASAPPAAAAP